MNMSKSHLFGDDRPFAACHASSLALLENGAYLVVWFGGTAEKNPDTAIWGANGAGATWSPPRRIVKLNQQAHWNPVLLVAPDGAIHLWFKVGRDPMTWSTWTCVSRDGGWTWTTPCALVPGDSGGRGPVKNKPLILSDGAWLAPASREYPDRWEVFVDRSDDGGNSWIASNRLRIDPAVTGLGVIQPTLWESRPGHVHMLMRSTCGRICRSDSKNSGHDWSAIYPTELANNNSGIDLARLDDGTLALASNPVAGDWAARTPLTLKLSGDNGHTWRHWQMLEEAPGEYSYPAIIAHGQSIAVSYTWRRERIAFWSGSVE